MLIEIDFNSDEALYVQLQNQIIMGIVMILVLPLIIPFLQIEGN